MKNIHVLPTEKPSRFFKDDFGKLFYSINIDQEQNHFKPQNIYITSDEEIKEGDYWIYICPISGLDYGDNGNPIVKNNLSNTWFKELHDKLNYKKIILTTDQDLIKDGVQAIDDEFLEWFVKNPSCEEVRVVDARYDISTLTDDIKKYPNLDVPDYKIIIPRTTQQIINEYYAGGLEMGQIIPKEEAKQEDCSCTDECLGYLTKTCKKIANSKQETLEEAINKEINNININSSNLENIAKYNRISGTLLSELKKSMSNIAKWQQERMYSEEEVKTILFHRETHYIKTNHHLHIDNWFEQFKKK